MTDQRELVQRILAGDKACFRALIEDYQRLVSHIVFRLIPSGPDREDVCQEVFIKVYEHLDRFRFDAKLSTWIARIAYNTCLNFLEKKKLPIYADLTDEDHEFEPAAGEDEQPDRVTESADTMQIVRAEIGRLPPVYKTVITLYHLEQMSYNEIGNIMKLPEGTVKSHLFRARRLLKQKLSATYQREEL